MGKQAYEKGVLIGTESGIKYPRPEHLRGNVDRRAAQVVEPAKAPAGDKHES